MQELILEEKTTLSPVMKEIYRRLRTNLEFTGIENKVICLTSCMENDGKSSVSFNLAKILAENDKRVLFIDADMRNSVLTKRTGIPDDLKGLSHYLAGKNAASEVIYATNYKNFYVIPTGRFPKNPTELLNKPAYDFVNTEVKDGTTVSEYMECFLKKEVNNSKFPAFTKRMNALKHEERGLNAVCEVMEKYEQKAVEEGLSLFEKAITMLASGKSPSEVVLTGVPQNIVDRASRAMKPKLNK